jgi:phosphoglycolate phosphatase
MATLFFDIDGTLIRTGGAGKAAMEAALRTAFDIAEIRDTIPYGGRTDPDIGRDLLRVHDLEPTTANYDRLREAYLSHLEPCLRTVCGHVLPGIVELLAELRSANRRVGLLTGNIEAGARVKLEHFGLWESFSFGGFGDGRHDRDDVARAALAAARARHGERLHDLWVIGDTPLDVKCARAIGAKCVAVATGWNSTAELAAAGADLALDDLSDFRKLPAEWFA